MNKQLKQKILPKVTDREQWSGSKVIVAPLNWGLGHATRCIPLIRSLLDAGADIVLASDGDALDVHRVAFPDLPFFQLPGYEMRYQFRSMALNVMVQSRHLFNTWRAEHRAIRHLTQSFAADWVLSDNRPGCYHPDLHSIYITHQINVTSANPLEALFAGYIHRRLMKPFDEIWVPDYPDFPGLGGRLSHGAFSQLNIRYIGPLSRFTGTSPKQNSSKRSHCVVAVVSGPEPQRSIWEQQLLIQMAGIKGCHLLVRGKPKGDGCLLSTVPSHIEVSNHLPDAEMQSAMQGAELVVSRSGYSSLMDYEQLGISALLVPTPGQPEQLYLGRKAFEEGRHLVMQQSAMNLGHALALQKNRQDKSFGE